MLYTCSHCCKTFIDYTPREEDLAKAKKDFPNVPESEFVSVCDDCYKLLLAYKEAQSN